MSHFNCCNVWLYLLFLDLQPNLLAIQTHVLMHLSTSVRALELFEHIPSHLCNSKKPLDKQRDFTPQFCVYEPYPRDTTLVSPKPFVSDTLFSFFQIPVSFLLHHLHLQHTISIVSCVLCSNILCFTSATLLS